jgi:hypothetical protein
LAQRVSGVITANEAAKTAAPASQHSHVAALTGQAQKERPVLGAHTAEVAARAGQAQETAQGLS